MPQEPRHHVLHPKVGDSRAGMEQRYLAIRYPELQREGISVRACQNDTSGPLREYIATYTYPAGDVQVGVLVGRAYPSRPPVCRLLSPAALLGGRAEEGVRRLAHPAWRPDLELTEYFLWLKQELEKVVQGEPRRG